MNKSVDQSVGIGNLNLELVFKNTASAQRVWQRLSYKERAKHVLKMADYLRDNADELSEIIAKDTGKLKIDALNTEVLPSIMSCKWYAKNAGKVLRKRLLAPATLLLFNKWSKKIYQPVGTVGIISPWNYPLTIPFGEIVMALMAGNAVVHKGDENTLEVNHAIQQIIGSADLPEGLFASVSGDGPQVLEQMLENGVDKVFFTGSSSAGKQVMQACAKHLVPCSLELGGNDAMLVLADAKVERAVSGGIWAAFQNAGQTCGGVKRVYVHKDVYDEFMALAVKKTTSLRHGHNGYDSDIGAITTEKQFNTLQKQLKSALAEGATIAAQSQAVGSQDGWFFPAILLANVTQDMAFIQEEVFGPFMPIIKVESTAQAIEFANDSQYALTASVWTSDRKMGAKVAQQIEAGVVTVNDHLYTHGMTNLEWGGAKHSGIGRTHGAQGLKEVSESKIISVDLISSFSKYNLWWFPFSKKRYEQFLGVAEFLKPSSFTSMLRVNWDVMRPMLLVMLFPKSMNSSATKSKYKDLSLVKKSFYRFVHILNGCLIRVLPFKTPKLLEGANSSIELVKLIKKDGHKSILVVTDQSLMNLGLLDNMLQALKKSDIQYTVHDGVQPNPSVENVEQGVDRYKEIGSEAIVAFGGGSVMDCAKVIGARIVCPSKPVHKLAGTFRVRRALPDLYCVPTTSGTGSETTVVAVISDTTKQRKLIIKDLNLVPKVAVLDPLLTLNLPPAITAATAMDALTHAVESYIGVVGTQFTNEQAEQATKLILDNIKQAYSDGSDVQVRENMALASFKAGLAFTRANVGYVHGIAHNLGALYGVPHGLANAIVLPYVLDFYQDAVIGKLAKLALGSGLGDAHESQSELSKRFIEHIKSLNEFMNIPKHVPQIKEQDVAKIVRRAMAESNPGYPVPKLMSPSQCESIIRSLMV